MGKQLMFMLWMTIDIIIFILSLPFMRNAINNQPHKVRKGVIYTEKSILGKVEERLTEGGICIVLMVMLYVMFNNFTNEAMQDTMKWFKGVFIVVFLPMIITWITNYKIKPPVGMVILGLMLSFVCYFVKIDDIKVIQQYKTHLSIVLSSLCIGIIWLIVKVMKEIYTGNKQHIHLYEDLIYRTPRINLKVNGTELIKMCEKYYYEYMRCLKKISEVKSIEFVNLNGRYRNEWYKKAAYFTRIFVSLSILYFIVELMRNFNVESLIGLIFIGAFGIIIGILKKKDMDFLQRITIRFFYDEWGYCLYCFNENDVSKKCKFVGEIQVIDKGKYHKYIHSLLNIASLCRAMALVDKIENEDNMELIVNTLYELVDNYEEDYVKNVNWMGALPLWVATIFEYKEQKEIPEGIKRKLNQYYVNEEVKHKINLFISGFWIYITQTMPGIQISSFVSGFINCIQMSGE